ncbi:sulfotransferase family protein [Gordonia iterans]
MARWYGLKHYWGYPPPGRMWLRKLGDDRVLPDFACVGSIKSGTSDLATNLFSHPSIVPPFAKEVFNTDPEVWRAYYPTVSEMRRVRRNTGNARTGYFTPALTFLDLPGRYRAAVPDAKVVLVLRDPVSRAYSQYKWELLVGGPDAAVAPAFVSYAAFVEASLAAYPEPAPTYCGLPLLQSGEYDVLTAAWLAAFGRDRIHLVRAEDYFADPATTLAGIYEFLELPAIDFVPVPRVNENPLVTPGEDPASKALLAEFYRPHNRRLAESFGRDMGWT